MLPGTSKTFNFLDFAFPRDRVHTLKNVYIEFAQYRGPISSACVQVELVNTNGIVVRTTPVRMIGVNPLKLNIHWPPNAIVGIVDVAKPVIRISQICQDKDDQQEIRYVLTLYCLMGTEIFGVKCPKMNHRPDDFPDSDLESFGKLSLNE